MVITWINVSQAKYTFKYNQKSIDQEKNIKSFDSLGINILHTEIARTN